MALLDYWELKDNQILSGKGVLNIYHLKRIQISATAQTVGDAFMNSILTATFLDAQDSNLTRTTVEVRNLGEPTDFATIDSSGSGGTDVGDHPAIFNAATIQLNRTRTDMKNGQKRFLMGKDADGSDGSWDAPFLANLATIAASLVATWKTAAAPAVDVCSLVILKRWCVVPGQDPCLKYRLPNSSAEVDANHYVPTSTLVRTRIRSQVSRKVL